MIIPLKGRLLGAIVGMLAAAIAIGGVVTASADPASAATVHMASAGIKPHAAQGCTGDVCMYLSNPSSGTVYVQAWAYNKNFYGHFELTRDGKFVANSYENTWYAGKLNWYQFNNISA